MMRGGKMQNDFHFKIVGCEVRAKGTLAVLAAAVVVVLIFSPVRAALF
jgi:hypothetical protein